MKEMEEGDRTEDLSEMIKTTTEEKRLEKETKKDHQENSKKTQEDKGSLLPKLIRLTLEQKI